MALYAGADAVKFQTFKSEKLVTGYAKMAKYQKDNIGVEDSQFNMLKKLELSYNQFEELKKYCEHKGIIFMSTPLI
jgi:N,N'-diacetyllegionaminate synthase